MKTVYVIVESSGSDWTDASFHPTSATVDKDRADAIAAELNKTADIPYQWFDVFEVQLDSEKDPSAT